MLVSLSGNHKPPAWALATELTFSVRTASTLNAEPSFSSPYIFPLPFFPINIFKDNKQHIFVLNFSSVTLRNHFKERGVYDPSTGEAEAGRPEVQDYRELQSEVRAYLC